jgi:CRISPR-associated endonuclease Cas1
MAATQTLPQVSRPSNSATPNGPALRPPTPIPPKKDLEALVPRRGVVSLFGYGIKVCVDRGHLILEDGIGADRRRGRFSRVRHGLKRVVVIGSDGLVSLAALRWLADQDAAFAMLDRNGKVLTVTGPVKPSDARLRRAQALANQSGVGLQIARELIGQKLAAQERLAGEGLHTPAAVEAIRQARSALVSACTTDALRLLESQAAYAYWSAWRNVPVNFPTNDTHRVPDHWLTFGTRISPLTGSPRLAVNPANAMLNYLYAVLESEARLAIAAIGLDPGIGVMHADNPIRDSLTFDVMEPIRPQVDAYVLDWISREQLRRDWFFEERNGNARLMGSFAVRLSETAPTWARAVAPVAESVARALWQTIPKRSRQTLPATRLTQSHRRKARGGPPDLPAAPPPRAPRLCRTCGAPLKEGVNYCAVCNRAVARQRISDLARVGRNASHTREAEARRAETQRRQAAALKAWNPGEQPTWLTAEVYRGKVRPKLADMSVPAISSALGISEPYAAAIRAGRRFPHPRHWQALAGLVSLTFDG